MAIAAKTKNVAVYDRLRQDILKGRLKPGQRVVMAELAKGLGLSETPVREAIRRLESEGFVDFTPHAGAIVKKIDERELAEIYLIRSALEELASRLAAPRVSAKDLEFLKRKNEEMEEALRQGEYGEFAALNRAFHLRIYKAAQMPRLYKMIGDLWDTFGHWPGVFAYVPERAAASLEEHRLIVEALSERDPARADLLTRVQKERTMEALKRYIAQGG